MELARKWREYSLLMRMDRPIGTFLLLWPTLWALWMAGDGHPQPWIVLIFVAGVFLMRSAGCVINDIADRDFDPHVERTRDRPLAAGRVTTREALGLFLALLFLALVLVLQLNRLTLLFAFIGVVLAASYPFFKRFTHLPQFVLGFAFSWGIPMAFAAHQNHVPPVAWVLMLANLAWVVAYDTMYAMADREDDRKIGVKSTAILFGAHDRQIIALLQIIALVSLVFAGMLASRGVYYYGGIWLAALFSVYQQVLIYRRQPADCFRAFLNNTWFGAAVFGGLLLDYL